MHAGGGGVRLLSVLPAIVGSSLSIQTVRLEPFKPPSGAVPDCRMARLRTRASRNAVRDGGRTAATAGDTNTIRIGMLEP